MEIFKLMGSILVDNEAANKSISETDTKVGGLAEKLSNGVGTAAKWAAGIAGGATAVGAAMFKAAESAGQVADTIDKGASRMDISTTKYQEFAYVAGQSGVEMSTMEKAAKKLEGTDLNLDGAMKSIMALTSEEERSAKAAELFGDAVAYQMSPMLAMSGEEMEAMQERAHELGIVMDEDAVSAGVKLGDTISDVKQSFSAVGTQLGTKFMPLVQQALDFILEHMPEIQSAISTAIDVVGNVISALIPVIMDLYGMIEQYIPAIKEFFSAAFTEIGVLWETVLKPALQALIDFCATTLFPAISTAFDAILPVVENVFNGIKDLWENTLKPIFTGIIDFITGVFTGDWEKAFDGLKSIVSTVFDGIVSVFKNGINGIIDKFNEFTSGLGSVSIPDWVPVVGGKTLSIPQIPRLAKGGTVVDDGTVMVGEHGAELLTLSKGASVVPLGGGVSDNGLSDKLDAVLNLMTQYMPNIGSSIVLNNGALVGSMAHEMDKALGRVQTQKARGV